MTFDDLSNWAAWYAAVVATGALAFEIWRYVHDIRAALSISIQPRMKLIQPGQPPSDVCNISIRHKGGQPTQLTHVAFKVYDSTLHRIITRHLSIVNKLIKLENPDLLLAFNIPTCPLPKNMSTGDTYTCYIPKDKLEFDETKLYYLVVAHSLADKDVERRVRF